MEIERAKRYKEKTCIIIKRAHQSVVVYSRNVLELYEYFFPFRHIWGDQKHRQTLNRNEVREMLGRACQAKSGCKP